MSLLALQPARLPSSTSGMTPSFPIRSRDHFRAAVMVGACLAEGRASHNMNRCSSERPKFGQLSRPGAPTWCNTPSFGVDPRFADGFTGTGRRGLHSAASQQKAARQPFKCYHVTSSYALARVDCSLQRKHPCLPASDHLPAMTSAKPPSRSDAPPPGKRSKERTSRSGGRSIETNRGCGCSSKEAVHVPTDAAPPHHPNAHQLLKPQQVRSAARSISQPQQPCASQRASPSALQLHTIVPAPFETGSSLPRPPLTSTKCAIQPPRLPLHVQLPFEENEDELGEQAVRVFETPIMGLTGVTEFMSGALKRDSSSKESGCAHIVSTTLIQPITNELPDNALLSALWEKAKRNYETRKWQQNVRKMRLALRREDAIPEESPHSGLRLSSFNHEGICSS